MRASSRRCSWTYALVVDDLSNYGESAFVLSRAEKYNPANLY